MSSFYIIYMNVKYFTFTLSSIVDITQKYLYEIFWMNASLNCVILYE